MLAPRILHFSKHQIFWDCAEMSACETLPAGLPLPLDQRSAIDRHWRGRLQEAGTSRAVLISGANDDSPEDFWRAAVDDYTSLDLTQLGDKRVAIWGIAKLVRDSLHEEYVAGMWELALVEQLAWRVADCTVAERPSKQKLNPSWSWTSVTGRILVESWSQQEGRAYQVLDHAGQPVSFEIDRSHARPKMQKSESESRREAVAAMGRELEMVANRRRSSTSMKTRQNSQSGTSSSRHNSQSSMKPTRKDSQGWFNSFDSGSGQSTPFGDRTMSPQPMNHGFETPRPITGQMTRDDSQDTLATKRDKEPKLLHTKLALHGFIQQGVMQWNDITSVWNIKLLGTPKSDPENVVIDAFPDIKRDKEDQHVYFIVLALSQFFEEQEVTYMLEEPLPEPKSWYVGHGIMLSPFTDDVCYARTGALQVRYLSTDIWEHMRKAPQIMEGTGLGPTDIAGERFYLM